MNTTNYVAIVFYDLPMVTSHEIKAYTKFRKLITNKGFYMLQASVYCATFNEKDVAKNTIKFIKQNTPPKGEIRALIITGAAFENMDVLLGERSVYESLVTYKNQIIEI